MVCLRLSETSATSLVWHLHPGNEESSPAAATTNPCWGLSTRHSRPWPSASYAPLDFIQEKESAHTGEGEDHQPPEASEKLDGQERGHRWVSFGQSEEFPPSAQWTPGTEDFTGSTNREFPSTCFYFLLKVEEVTEWVKNLWVKCLKTTEKWLLRRDRRADQREKDRWLGLRAPPGEDSGSQSGTDLPTIWFSLGALSAYM